MREEERERYARLFLMSTCACAVLFLFVAVDQGYVIMLSGAHDILKRLDPDLGTGAVLLADILPTLLIKSAGQLILFRFSYTARVVACILAALVSFLLVSTERNKKGGRRVCECTSV